MTFEEFVEVARDGGLVPVSLQMPMAPDAAVAAFAALRRPPFAFLLESAPAGSKTWARYTYMGTEPRSAWRTRDGLVQDWLPVPGWHGDRRPADPLADLERLLTTHQPVHDPRIAPFWGGVVGFMGYDMVRYIERCGAEPPGADDVPDAMFMVTRTVVVLDNEENRAHIVVGIPVTPGADVSELRTSYDEALAEARQVQARLTDLAALPPIAGKAGPLPGTTTSIERPRFLELVNRIKEHIFAGDAFQVLISRRMEVKADFDPPHLYRALRAINPSPFMFHLTLDGLEIVGSSPELLVRLDDGRVTLRPIAGTRPRSEQLDETEDAKTAQELLADPKERAEHLMLVDLGRNDVGRVAQFGSVRTTSFMKVERYSHVFHLVSEVEGLAREAVSAMDVFRATFPAGTMTGAPKVRAMQLINEMEPVRRGPYAGGIGYIAAGGSTMELAITIRSCVINGGVAAVQAGAGIVADSVPEREWEETENKAKAVLTAIGRARATREAEEQAARTAQQAAQ